MHHLIFYDGTCGLCDQMVRLLLTIDKHKIFAFAPLHGTTAVQYLSALSEKQKTVDSLIFLENFRTEKPKIFIQAKAIFRIFWLLGGPWILLGWLSFLPSFPFDWAYQLIAKYRHHIFPQRCLMPRKNQLDRFLP